MLWKAIKKRAVRVDGKLQEVTGFLVEALLIGIVC